MQKMLCDNNCVITSHCSKEKALLETLAVTKHPVLAYFTNLIHLCYCKKQVRPWEQRFVNTNTISTAIDSYTSVNHASTIMYWVTWGDKIMIKYFVYHVLHIFPPGISSMIVLFLVIMMHQTLFCELFLHCMPYIFKSPHISKFNMK
jgi:hypothetical protein